MILFLIIAVVVLIVITDPMFDHDKCEEEEKEGDPALAGDRIRILIEFPHDKE